MNLSIFLPQWTRELELIFPSRYVHTHQLAFQQSFPNTSFMASISSRITRLSNLPSVDPNVLL